MVLTFDDGYMDNYTYAFPVLKSLKIPATIFLTTNFIGSKNAFWWDKMEYAIRNTKRRNIKLNIGGKEVSLSLRNLKDKIGALAFITKVRVSLSEEESRAFIEEVIEKLGIDPDEFIQKEEDYLALDWDKIKEMKNNGISFGAHTANHVILTRCSKEEAEKEIYESKERIESVLGEGWFAYPSGRYDKSIKETVVRAGFSCAVTTIQGMNDLQTDPYEIRRIAVSNRDDFLSFLGKLTGTTFFL